MVPAVFATGAAKTGAAKSLAPETWATKALASETWATEAGPTETWATETGPTETWATETGPTKTTEHRCRSFLKPFLGLSTSLIPPAEAMSTCLIIALKIPA
jgi:hypothetical protein